MFEIARKFFLDLILDNEEVKKFPKDFVTTSMKWIRSWFLTDDPVAEGFLDSTSNELEKTATVEQKLAKLFENETFRIELEERLFEYAAQKQTLKNIVDNASIEVEGNVHIGDQGHLRDSDQDQKNIVKDSSIKVAGDFRVGDNIV